ncbi:hypothetical protein SAMN05518672_10167 [Chitinophaga sp. CF118]|uniref:DUF5691 domain-containing protein n=1 Tax=Chitinophaga sp. CF118 TaxID=1884367 RepID=UPI0008E3FE6E|nr:DUF5691 domain-containing protein [Chitinophaga sp. CF118]SFD01949.1 hypothetical protein SAMN05518672_10167 [Chitinophaga sp. CF118]
MQFWNHIIQTAMLGTDKKQIAISELPEAMANATTIITGNTAIDKEEQFLQIASLAANYRQSGAQPLHKEGITIELAPPEEKPYCSNRASGVLKDILDEDSNPLLALWLEHCVSAGQLTTPLLLPLLLDKATQHKTLRTNVEQCMGKRGEWLCGFNKNWQFSAAETDEERWQTGKPDQRRQVLQQLRNTNPALAREWLQQTWAQENANSKAELIKALEVNLGAEDVEWLESISTEKSQKVKEETLNLLRQIPSSTIIQQYWQIVQQAVTLKKESAFLGLGSKTALSIQLPAVVDDKIFKTGIEKLSNDKAVSDEDFILYQLISFIPPDFWETHFNETPTVIYQLFSKHENLLPALGEAAGRFKNRTWAPLFTGNTGRHYLSLLQLLPAKVRDAYVVKHFDDMQEMVIPFITQDNMPEWSMPVAMAAIIYTASEPSQFTRSFYSKNIHLIPVQMAAELANCTPADPYKHYTWRSTSEYLLKLLRLKERIIQSFS